VVLFPLVFLALVGVSACTKFNERCKLMPSHQLATTYSRVKPLSPIGVSARTNTSTMQKWERRATNNPLCLKLQKTNSKQTIPSLLPRPFTLNIF